MRLSGSSLVLCLGLWIPILLLEASRSQLPACLEMSSCTALPVGSGHPAGARGGTRDVAVVPLTFHSCPSPLSPPQGHGGALGLVAGQGFGTSLRTWGAWAAYGLEPMKTWGLEGSGRWA